MKPVLLFLISFVAFICEKNPLQPQPQVTPIEFTEIPLAPGFRMPNPGTDVIRSDSVWTFYWNQYWVLYDGSNNKIPAPSMDFAQKMVIAVFYGDGKYSGCDDRVNVIDKIEQVDQTIRVTVKRLPYLGGCYAIVAPIQMVQISWSSLPVEFVGVVPS